MADFVVRINALDFAQIDASLGQVRVAIDAGKELSVAGLDPTALLGDLGTVISAVQKLEADPAALGQLARTAVEALGDLIELPELGDLDGLVSRVEELVELISRLASALAVGDLDGPGLIDRILTTVGGSPGLSSLIADVTARAAGVLQVEVPDQLAAPLRALARLGAGGAIDGRQLTEILSMVVVGLEVAEMLTLTVSVRGAVDLVASAGDVGGVEAAIAAVHARIAACYDLLAVGGAVSIDVSAVLTAIDEVRVALDLLGGVELPRLIDGVATDLRTAENTLAELDVLGTVERLLTDLPLPGEDIPRIMVDSLSDVADFFDTMTPEAMTAALAAAQAELSAALNQGPLVELLDGIDDAFESLGREVDRLPLGSLRDTLVSALVDAQRHILAFDGFNFLDEIVAPVRTLEATVREVDLSSITDAAQAVVDQVNGIFADFPIGELRDAVDGVIEPLGEILDELTPVVQQIAEQLEALVGELESIDFEGAAAETVDQLHGIRDQVSEAVNDGDVPEPVKVVVAGAAAILSEMDLAAELTSPFETAMVSIDVDALLAPIEGVWESAGSALRRATPQALIAELDPSFEQLLAKVDELSLEPLIASIGGVFEDLVGTLEAIDPRRVVAPLEQDFQALLANLRATLDPAPLFAPLRTAYAELRGFADQIDIKAVIDGVLGGMLEMPGGLSQAVGNQLASQAGPGGVVTPTPGVEFKFGDVLRPMAAFVAEIRSRLGQLAGDVTGSALAELAGATRTLRALADPLTGFAVQLADALDARLRWLDPRAGDGPLAELRSELESLGAAVAQVQLEAGAQAQLASAAGSVQFDARIHIDVQATAAVQVHAGRMREGANSPDLGRSTRLLANALDAALPSVLVTEGVDPTADVEAFLDAVFARIDPAPMADELDGYGVRIQGRLTALADELTLGLYRLWKELFAGVEPLLPASVVGRVQAGLDGLTAKLDVLDPAAVESEARAVIEAAISLLDVHSPAALAAELGAVFDAAIERVRELDPALLLGDLDPFGDLKAQLAELRPSLILAPLVERAASFTVALETIATIDLSFVHEIVAQIKVAFGVVLEGIEREWDALLEELGSISGGVSVSVEVG